jgi:hypothetical protein
VAKNVYREEYCLRGCNAVQSNSSPSTFQSNTLLPYSCPRCKWSKKVAGSRSWAKSATFAACFSLTSWLAYSLVMNMEALCSSETLMDFCLIVQCYILDDKPRSSLWDLKCNKNMYDLVRFMLVIHFAYRCFLKTLTWEWMGNCIFLWHEFMMEGMLLFLSSVAERTLFRWDRLLKKHGSLVLLAERQIVIFVYNWK